MKKLFLIILCALWFCGEPALGQRVELGIFGGTSYYIGDLNPSRHFELPQPAFGGLVRYNVNPRISLKFNGYYGNVVGDDAITKSSDFAVNRNLHFKSHILEFGTQVEINFLKYVTGHRDYFFTPYIFGGISVFNFNPKAEYEGQWYDLQPLGTEGQGTVTYHEREPYKLTALALPFGVGFKYSMSNNVCFGLEWGMRKTNTDYLDDVSTTYADPNIIHAESGPIAAALSDRSIKTPGEAHNTGLQRGNSQSNDWYSFAGVFVTFRISYKRRGDCPTYQTRRKYREYYVD